MIDIDYNALPYVEILGGLVALLTAWRLWVVEKAKLKKQNQDIIREEAATIRRNLLDDLRMYREEIAQLRERIVKLEIAYQRERQARIDAEAEAATLRIKVADLEAHLAKAEEELLGLKGEK